MAEAASAAPKADPEDNKKNQKDKWKNFFTPSNPDLWIALGVIALIIILVCMYQTIAVVWSALSDCYVFCRML